VGLLGMPNAGKSTFIAAVSNARPKIADYPFTTLHPNLGVVRVGPEKSFVIADVPGLIEGAAEGRGLGHDFLRHIERCAALVHVVDTASIEPGRNPVDDLDVIEGELARYGGLEDRPRLVALNKIDVPDGRDIADMVVEELRGRGLRVFEVSAASGAGLRELTFAMAEIVTAARAAAPAVETERIVLRPRAVDGGDDFEVLATEDGWRVRGTKPERWVRQTDFSNDEAVGFLADRLLEQRRSHLLLELGAEVDRPVTPIHRTPIAFDTGRLRGERLAQLDQRAQVGADEVQYERKRTREIANLRPRDHRPAASTGLQVEHALQFQKTQRLTQCGAGDFVPREHVVLRRQPVADLACVGLDVVHDRLRHAKRALAPCERERLALLIHVRHQ